MLSRSVAEAPPSHERLCLQLESKSGRLENLAQKRAVLEYNPICIMADSRPVLLGALPAGSEF